MVFSFDSLTSLLGSLGTIFSICNFTIHYKKNKLKENREILLGDWTNSSKVIDLQRGERKVVEGKPTLFFDVHNITRCNTITGYRYVRKEKELGAESPEYLYMDGKLGVKSSTLYFYQDADKRVKIAIVKIKIKNEHRLEWRTVYSTTPIFPVRSTFFKI